MKTLMIFLMIGELFVSIICVADSEGRDGDQQKYKRNESVGYC